MSHTITLQPAMLSEAATVARINKAAYDSDTNEFGEGGDGGPPGYDSVDWVKETFTKRQAYTIRADDRIIGWFFLEDVNESTVELHSFAIDPALHNRGYGFAALLQMERLIPREKTWILGTPQYSVRNQHLYEKAGFRRVGISDDGFLIRYEKKLQ